MNDWLTDVLHELKNGMRNRTFLKIRNSVHRVKTKNTVSQESYHIVCPIKRNSSRMSLSQLSVSYSLRENSLCEGKILGS